MLTSRPEALALEATKQRSPGLDRDNEEDRKRRVRGEGRWLCRGPRDYLASSLKASNMTAM